MRIVRIERIFICPAEMAEMAEIFILTQRRRGRRVLFEHGLNGLNGFIILCLVGTGYICRKHCPSRFYRICRVTLSHIYPRLPYSR